MPPAHRARRCVQARKNTADAQREQAPISVNRGGLRPLAMPLRGRVHRIRGRVGVAPNFAARGEVEPAGDLVFARAGEDVDAVLDDERGRVPFPDRDLPFARQLSGAAGGHYEIGQPAIPVRPAPLRPILRGGRYLPMQYSLSCVRMNRFPCATATLERMSEPSAAIAFSASVLPVAASITKTSPFRLMR